MIRGSSFTARLFTAVLVVLGLSLTANLVGCGSSSTPPPTGITIQGPTSGSIDPGDAASFTATVTNDAHNAGVTWMLTGAGCTGSACGALSGSTTTGVIYTAPATVTTAFTVTITVTSVADSSITTTITLSVPANPTIGTAAGALAGGVIGTPYSVTLAGAGGITPYTWSVTQGVLPMGLTLSTSGVISGTPTAAGTANFTVTLTDSGSPALTATESYTIAISYPPPVIATTTLPNGTFGTAYTAILSATGGSGTGYTWTVTSGTGLSAVGLSLSPGGLISGTPNAAETAGTFAVTVTDSAGGTATASFLLTIVYPAITITPTTLTSGAVGIVYSQSLTASGGNGTGYSYAVTSGTGLSAVGLSLSSSGSITGTPTASETAGTFVVTATDGVGNKGTATITLTVYLDLTVTTTTLPNGIVGTAYSQTLNAIAGSGTGYTWAVTSGASNLSSVGLSLSSSGVISGSTPVAGTATFTVRVTDSASNTATANLSVTIYPSLVVSTTSLANGMVGTAYTATLTATGGSGTDYTWAVTSGTGLSAVGLSLSTSGAITGTPTSGESAVSFMVQVTDSNGDTATGTLTLTVATGQVLSGQQPVAGATIQLYTVGNSGNGSAATPMLTQTVTTDDTGMFNLAGLYTCGQNSTGSTIAGTSNQVYLVATGGSTSLTSAGNGALAMVTAAGSCGNLTSTSFFTINEITTAAAAWALTPFSTSATNIGASATNTLGITNAFLDAALLANPATGAPATLPANLTVETGKLAALADALNTCTASADGTGCNTLFAAATPANGTAPINSFNAALNIVQNPGQNVAAVYAVIPTATTPPFATTLTASPNDWTMSLTVTGGGLDTPTTLGIDSQNNVWVADEAGPVSAFNAQGTPLSSTGYGILNGSSITSNSYGLAVDPSNNIWITNQQNATVTSPGSVIELYGVNNPAALVGSSPNPGGYSNGIQYPVSVAADTYGNIYVANTGAATSVTVYSSSTGNVISSYLGSGSAFPAGDNSVAVDINKPNPGFWLSDNSQTVEHFSSTGNLLVNAECCADSLGIATDSAGNLWIADYIGGGDGRGAIAEAVTDSSGNTSVPISGLVTGGIQYPQGVAVDAAQNVWFSNFQGKSITEIAGINAPTLAAAISPSTGVYGTGGYGLDADLAGPYSLLPDLSGNLWVANESADTLTMFFGLAAPTVTPLQPVPTAP